MDRLTLIMGSAFEMTSFAMVFMIVNPMKMRSKKIVQTVNVASENLPANHHLLVQGPKTICSSFFWSITRDERTREHLFANTLVLFLFANKNENKNKKKVENGEQEQNKNKKKLKTKNKNRTRTEFFS